MLFHVLDESDTFERDWDGRIHSFKSGDMIVGGKYKLPSQRMAISSQPYNSHDYDDTTTKERKKKQRHHRDYELDHEHKELDHEYVEHDQPARTRPHDSHKPYHHERTILPEEDHHHGHHSRPKAPGVGHRSSKHKSVKFPEGDEKPTRKQHHHYHSSRRTQDDHHRHSIKKPSTLV